MKVRLLQREPQYNPGPVYSFYPYRSIQLLGQGLRKLKTKSSRVFKTDGFWHTNSIILNRDSGMPISIFGHYGYQAIISAEESILHDIGQ